MTNQDYHNLIKDIKVLSQEQRLLKPQRKDDHNLKVDRTINKWDAIEKASSNKFKLRHMYHLLGIIRKKEIPLPKRKGFSYYSLNKLKEKYNYKEESVIVK